MPTNYLTYEFNTDTVSYSASYDSTKLNMGHLMTRSIDTNSKTYVSPIEPGFLRGVEITSATPYSFTYPTLNSLGSIKYDSDTTWLFAASADSVGSGAATKRILLSTYKKSTNQLMYVGSINASFDPNTYHTCVSIKPSLEYHTTGSITVIGTQVTGSGTSWQTDGACVGNRIGFGSTSSADITTWYQISSVSSNTALTITRGVATDGFVPNLNITGSTPYVIEDFRLLYVNYGDAIVASRAIILVKGLRPEIFTTTPTAVPAATTVDNIRACYRLVDGATTSAVYTPISMVLEPKNSFTQQYAYSVSEPGTTLISIQQFNVRAPLILTSGRASSSFGFTTGAQAHGGTNTSQDYNVMETDNKGNYYVSHYTRMSRIPTGSIVSGSTTFIANHMIENPPGGTGSFALSAQLADITYLPKIDRFYISHLQGTIRNYVTRFSSGSQFEAQTHVNHVNQQSTYLVSEFDYLTPHFIATRLSSNYCDGILFVARAAASSNNNIIYSLPLEADQQFETTSSACIITPELSTPSASAYNKVYVDNTEHFNTTRFAIPREPYTTYYRTTGISDDSGAWNLVSPSGSISGSAASIQFKLTFSTLGYYNIPSRIHGITLSYSSSIPQQTISNYDPSLSQTNIGSQIFAWRQTAKFNQNIPNLNLNLYSGSTLVLTDSVSTSLSGSWEYSTTEGNIWLPWSSTPDAVNNYIRYTATNPLPSGSVIRALLYI